MKVPIKDWSKSNKSSVLLQSNVLFASMVRDQITSVCAFSRSIKYIADQK